MRTSAFPCKSRTATGYSAFVGLNNSVRSMIPYDVKPLMVKAFYSSTFNKFTCLIDHPINRQYANPQLTKNNQFIKQFNYNYGFINDLKFKF